jgi:hypothetical protein
MRVVNAIRKIYERPLLADLASTSIPNINDRNVSIY